MCEKVELSLAEKMNLIQNLMTIKEPSKETKKFIDAFVENPNRKIVASIISQEKDEL